MAYFRCKKEGCSLYNKDILVSPYVMRAVNGVSTYYPKGDKEQIRCKECGSALEIVEEEFGGFATGRLSFSSLSPQQKREALKRRANEHFKRNTEGMREYRDHVEETSSKEMRG